MLFRLWTWVGPKNHLLVGGPDTCRGIGIFGGWWFFPLNCRHTHTRLTALFSGLPRWAGTRKVKPIWILLKQQTVSGSGISWAVCKSAPRSRQITTPAPHYSVFYRPDALPTAQPTVSKHWYLQGNRHFLERVVYPFELHYAIQLTLQQNAYFVSPTYWCLC